MHGGELLTLRSRRRFLEQAAAFGALAVGETLVHIGLDPREV